MLPTGQVQSTATIKQEAALFLLDLAAFLTQLMYHLSTFVSYKDHVELLAVVIPF